MQSFSSFCSARDDFQFFSCSIITVFIDQLTGYAVIVKQQRKHGITGWPAHTTSLSFPPRLSCSIVKVR